MADRRFLALTIIQPWASLITMGPKRVENRTWAPRELAVGDYLAVHAGAWHTRRGGPCDQWGGARETAEEAGLLGSIPLLDGMTPLLAERGRVADHRQKHYAEKACAYGAVVGVARLAGVEREAPPGDPWWFGPVGWRLSEVVAIDPVACRGAQGLWPLPPEVLATVRERYREGGRRG